MSIVELGGLKNCRLMGVLNISLTRGRDVGECRLKGFRGVVECRQPDLEVSTVWGEEECQSYELKIQTYKKHEAKFHKKKTL